MTRSSLIVKLLIVSLAFGACQQTGSDAETTSTSSTVPNEQILVTVRIPMESVSGLEFDRNPSVLVFDEDGFVDPESSDPVATTEPMLSSGETTVALNGNGRYVFLLTGLADGIPTGTSGCIWYSEPLVADVEDGTSIELIPFYACS